MASFPYFVLGPNAALSILGLLRGPDRTPSLPAEDWRQAQVDVVIPALNEEETILLCLASVVRQTLRPREIVLIDDASTDRTVEYAREFCRQAGVPITIIRRAKSIGKTPTIKREARDRDSDVEFILDADTVLESDDYIERAVQELYKGVGIASACGTILPLRRADRRTREAQPLVKNCFAALGAKPRPVSRLEQFARGITNIYREVLYLFLQRFIYHGQMVFYGSITNPVGCAVAYRRKYVKDLFAYVTPRLGDDLTNSEDIFIGFALLNEGYRNVQLTDVVARTVEPPVTRLPRQVYLWSSSFLQSCYYFDPLVRSPLKLFHRPFRSDRVPRAAKVAPATAEVQLAGAGIGSVAGHLGPVMQRIRIDHPAAVHGSMALSHGARHDRRLASEPYRQAFGRDRTRRFGRPVGWILLASVLEKVFLPTALLTMVVVRNWEGLALTVLGEGVLGLAALVYVAGGQRLEFLLKGIVAMPIRYLLIVAELVTLAKFSTDLWITRDRKWRK